MEWSGIPDGICDETWGVGNGSILLASGEVRALDDERVRRRFVTVPAGRLVRVLLVRPLENQILRHRRNARLAAFPAIGAQGKSAALGEKPRILPARRPESERFERRGVEIGEVGMPEVGRLKRFDQFARLGRQSLLLKRITDRLESDGPVTRQLHTHTYPLHTPHFLCPPRPL